MARIDPRAAIAAGALVISTALGLTYGHEGGYVNHKDDRGGETIYGVTIGTAREFGYTGAMRDFPKHCDAGHPICADLIYTTKYIDRPGYRPMAEIEPAVFFEMYDSAVLHGPSRASGWFQGSLNALCGSGLETDGKVGRRTIAAYQRCQEGMGKAALCVAMLDNLDRAQLHYFNRIVAARPSQQVFYRGWVKRRIGNVDRRRCLS